MPLFSSDFGLTKRRPSPKIYKESLPECGPVAQLGARFHGMEEVIGSIPIRSTKQPLTNQAYVGRLSLPPLHDFVSFCVTRAEGLRRLLTTAAVEADSF